MPRARPPAKATKNDLAVAFLVTVVVAGVVLIVARYVKSRQEEEAIASPVPSTIARQRALEGAQLFRGLPAPSRDGATLYWAGWWKGTGGLLAMPATGGEVKALDEGVPASGSRPSVSPDGRLVAWLADDDGLGLALVRVYEVAAGAAHGCSQLHLRADAAAGLHWWPQSEELMYVEPESRRLMRLDLSTGKAALAAEGIQCAPGGEGLRIARTRDAVLAYDSVSRHVLGTPNRSACLEYVVPAPDGRVTAIVEAPYSRAMRLAELILLSSERHDRPRNSRGAPIWAVYVPEPGYIEWSPDSSRLLYYWRGDGVRSPVGILRDDAGADAAVLSREDGSVVRLLRWPGEAREHKATWLDADNVLYLEDTGPQRLWRIEVSSGLAHVLLGDANAASEEEVESR